MRRAYLASVTQQRRLSTLRHGTYPLHPSGVPLPQGEECLFTPP
jgi:hypothetical protein